MCSYSKYVSRFATRGLGYLRFRRLVISGKIKVFAYSQGWAKLVLIALERYSVELKRLTFNFR
jgi:hypothetical protein